MIYKIFQKVQTKFSEEHKVIIPQNYKISLAYDKRTAQTDTSEQWVGVVLRNVPEKSNPESIVQKITS